MMDSNQNQPAVSAVSDSEDERTREIERIRKAERKAEKRSLAIQVNVFHIITQTKQHVTPSIKYT